MRTEGEEQFHLLSTGEAPRQQKPGEHGRGKHDYNPTADNTHTHTPIHKGKQETRFP